MRVAQHLELDQVVAVEELARQAQRAHGVLGAIAAGGVRQVGELRGRQRVEQARLLGVLADVGATDRHRDDLRARGLDRGARLGEILVLAGADQQARRIGLAGDDERIAHASAAADGDDDFKPVAVLEHDLLVLAARHDLAVSLHRDFFPGHREPLENLPHVHWSVEPLRCAVDRHLNHEPDFTP